MNRAYYVIVRTDRKYQGYYGPESAREAARVYMDKGAARWDANHLDISATAVRIPSRFLPKPARRPR